MRTVYTDEEAIEFSEKQLAEFFTHLQHRKQVIDLQEQNTFDWQVQQLEVMNTPPILSTGGYNDTFLRFVSSVFQAKIFKCRETLRFVVKAIDYVNRTTNDCFFKLIGPVN